MSLLKQTASPEVQYGLAPKDFQVSNTCSLSSILDRTPAMRAHFLQMEKYLKPHASPQGERTGMTPRDQLIVSNYRLAISIASRYRGNGLEMEDLIGFAYIGLILAADHFDPTKGTEFAPYACRWIQGEVCRGLTDTGHSIRLPKHSRKFITNIRDAQKQFVLLHGRDAIPEELAETLNIPVQTINDILLTTAGFDSLDATVGDAEDAYTLADTIAADTEDYATEDEIRCRLKQVLSRLKPRERTIIEGIHLQGKDFQQLARELGLTATRVRQVYRTICPKL